MVDFLLYVSSIVIINCNLSIHRNCIMSQNTKNQKGQTNKIENASQPRSQRSQTPYSPPPNTQQFLGGIC